MERTGLQWPEVLLCIVGIALCTFIFVTTDSSCRIPPDTKTGVG